MLLLPVSHEDGVVRRLPMVSLGVLSVCFAMQVHSCAVTPDIEQRLATIEEEMERVELTALQEHYASQTDEEAQEIEDDALEVMAQGGTEREINEDLLELDEEGANKFRAGELTDTDDPNYLRYLELREEHKALELELPVIRFGYRPALDGLASLIASMFAHGGWFHLLGNMWFLYLVGCNLEDRWGRWQFSLFYLVAGVLAALSFGALHPDMTDPLVGASGAIAGAMGAFMVCYARTRVKMFYFYFMMISPRWGTFHASAWFVLALWIAEQLLMTLVEISSAGGGVAYSAHAGGFAFGALVAWLLRRSGIDSQLDRASEQAADSAGEVWSEHPLYLKAMELRDRAEDATAIERLIQLLAEAPTHVGAREALFELGIAHRNLQAIDLGVPFLIDRYAQQQDHRSLLRLFQELRRTVPSYGFTDQELMRLAAAAQRNEDGPLAIRMIGELLQQWPGSSFEPKGLWLVAEVQGKLGAADLQQQTLARILQRFPQHACAKLARDVLGRAEATA